MKFGVVNKSTILNRFVLHILQRNIMRLAVITRKTNINSERYFERGNWKRAKNLSPSCSHCDFTIMGEQFFKGREKETSKIVGNAKDQTSSFLEKKMTQETTQELQTQSSWQHSIQHTGGDAISHHIEDPNSLVIQAENPYGGDPVLLEIVQLPNNLIMDTLRVDCSENAVTIQGQLQDAGDLEFEEMLPQEP